MELLGAQAASTVDLIGIEASPQQKDTGMTSPIDRIEASNRREVQYTSMASIRTSLD